MAWKEVLPAKTLPACTCWGGVGGRGWKRMRTLSVLVHVCMNQVENKSDGIPRPSRLKMMLGDLPVQLENDRDVADD